MLWQNTFPFGVKDDHPGECSESYRRNWKSSFLNFEILGVILCCVNKREKGGQGYVIHFSYPESIAFCGFQLGKRAEFQRIFSLVVFSSLIIGKGLLYKVVTTVCLLWFYLILFFRTTFIAFFEFSKNLILPMNLWDLVHTIQAQSIFLSAGAKKEGG